MGQIAERPTKKNVWKIYRDSMQNYKVYGIPHAQLIIADVPYNVGINFYGSNPQWYKDGNNQNGIDPAKAGKAAFNSDFNFNLYEFFHFSSRMLKPEPKEKGTAGCLIVFCSMQQMSTLIDAGAKQGFKNYIYLTFIKNYSPQVLKANMRIVGATEHALLMFREKLPKFNNNGKMVFDWFEYGRDGDDIPKIHPAQKPVAVLKKLIEVFTDPGDVVIDPCCGSGSTIRAAMETGRSAFGFEIDRNFYNRAINEMLDMNWAEKKSREEDKKSGQVNLFELLDEMA